MQSQPRLDKLTKVSTASFPALLRQAERMASVLSLLSCCLQRKPSRELGTPNERSHLIPATTDPSPSSSNAFVVDHQQLKERMSHIVRSKEGKMVNVNSRLPFNLHNKKLSINIDPSSSSRSASTSTNQPSLNFSPLSATPHPHDHVQARVGAPLVPSSTANTAPSRSSSLASRETSVHDSDKSVRRSPILNLRLVRGLPTGSSGVTSAARRGRAKRKAEESTNGGSGFASPSNGPSLETADEGSATSLNITDTPSQVPHVPTSVAPSIPHPAVSISPASTIIFELQDTGPLTVSWGD